MPKTIQFDAQLDPGVKTAVGFDNDGAATIKLLAPSSQRAEILKLIFLGKGSVMTFEVTGLQEGDKLNGKNKGKREKTYVG